MQKRQWKATWTNQQGEAQEYAFIAPDHRLMAEIDFQHTTFTRTGEFVERFALEAGRPVMPVVSSLQELMRRGQL